MGSMESNVRQVAVGCPLHLAAHDVVELERERSANWTIIDLASRRKARGDDSGELMELAVLCERKRRKRSHGGTRYI